MKRYWISSLFIFVAITAGINTSLMAQIKITDGADLTMDQNSLLELQSTNKGILPPRIAINNIYLPTPLTAPVPAGMLVYSTGGAVTDGYYYWTGTKWCSYVGSKLDVREVSSNTTLTKTDEIVFAYNNITVTLPAITSADSGLVISINNVGSKTDYVLVAGNGGATIDGFTVVPLTPNNGYSFIARGTNWRVKDRPVTTVSTMDVGLYCPWATISDAIDFLKLHMFRPAVIRLSPGTHYIANTIIIDLPYTLTIEGISYGEATLGPSTGMGGKPLFRCKSDCNFKMLDFDASTLSGYGSAAGEDGIRLLGSGTYNEIKDCTFEGLNIAILDSTNAELWLFENDISNSVNTALMMHSAVAGAKVRISETDFFGNPKGFYLSKGSNVMVSVLAGFFSNQNATDTSIVYRASRLSFSSLIIKNVNWNYIGVGLYGLDFTRSDGRDADAVVENNSSSFSSTPYCKINVVNNVSTTNLGGVPNTWVKANWTNTSSIVNNIAVVNNKITKLPTKTRNIYFIISGNVQVNNTNRVITVGLVKNGVTTYRYGETTLRITTANQAFQFSTVILVENVAKNDYFELYASSTNGWDQLVFQDINILCLSE
jgi:hypothetical protein